MLISSVGSEGRIKGFTLIEVLVVLLILALSMAVVVPAVSKRLGGSLDETARDVQVALRQARSEAVLQQRSTALLFDVTAKRYRLERSRESQALPDTFRLTASVADIELKNGVAGIRFFPDGSSTGGFIRLAVGDSQRQINVDWLTGRVSVAQEGDG